MRRKKKEEEKEEKERKKGPVIAAYYLVQFSALVFGTLCRLNSRPSFIITNVKLSHQ